MMEAHLVKWQNTGEVPVVRKGRRRDEDTELGDTSPKTVWENDSRDNNAGHQLGVGPVWNKGCGRDRYAGPVAEAQFLGNPPLLKPGDTHGGPAGAAGGGRADAYLSLGALCPLSWAWFPHL